MPENIHQRLAMLTPAEQRLLTPLFDAVLADLTELRTQLTALRVDVAAVRTQVLAGHVDIDVLRAAFVALTAKMDADFADVTNASVDYASSVDPAAMTIVDPAALTATAPAALTLQS